MRVYIAAPYAARAQAKAYADELHRMGIAVTARWLDEDHEINGTTIGAASGLTDEQASQHAGNDIDDIGKADTFVVLTESACRKALNGLPSTSGGRHVETGWFLATRGAGHVIVVGDPENIFHRLRLVTVVVDWHEAVLELAARHRARLLDRAIPVAG